LHILEPLTAPKPYLELHYAERAFLVAAHKPAEVAIAAKTVAVHNCGGLTCTAPKVAFESVYKLKGFNVISGLAAALMLTTAPSVQAVQQQPAKTQSKIALQRNGAVFDTYILGPGDSLQIELLDIPELSGTFSIGPDGTMYLPRLRALYVEGLTVEELRYFLTQQFKAYVRNPQLYVRPVAYRPIRIYVGGEVRRPGYYTLRGLDMANDKDQQQVTQSLKSSELNQSYNAAISTSLDSNADSNKQAFPTVFDAIRAAQGISPFSDLAKVQVTRKQPLSAGGGRLRTNLDFLSLITEGDESQNIRLFDGDVVSVGKSSVVLRDQLIQAGKTNLSPQFMNVFVSGRVRTPGAVTLQQGTSLNQAISVAGGVKLLRGKVEFLRLLSDGKTDRRTFSYSPNSPANSFSNPILSTGDIIRVNESPLSASIGVLNEVATPVLGIYSIYALTYGAFR
jgi:polysaccharide export outer membrane protein